MSINVKGTIKRMKTRRANTIKIRCSDEVYGTFASRDQKNCASPVTLHLISLNCMIGTTVLNSLVYERRIRVAKTGRMLLPIHLLREFEYLHKKIISMIKNQT